VNFNYKISKEEYSGILLIEYIDDKPNCVWELEFVRKRIHTEVEFENDFDKHSIKRCINWLINNHSELLL
jgi:hypothetical protein